MFVVRNSDGKYLKVSRVPSRSGYRYHLNQDIIDSWFSDNLQEARVYERKNDASNSIHFIKQCIKLEIIPITINITLL